MGTPLLLEVIERPATSGTVALLIATFLFLHSRQLGYQEVGLSYNKIRERELWRVVTAQVSHIDILHLIFNCSALWSLGHLEKHGWGPGRRGSIQYLGTSVLLALLAGAATVAVYHLLIHHLQQERFQHITLIGYSAVVFAWMTLHALNVGGSFSIGGLAVPMSLAPFGSLALSSIIVRRASFVGHLAGILCGGLVSTAMFDWLDAWWSISLILSTLGFLVWNLVQTGHLQVSFLQIDSNPDLEDGSTLLRAPVIALPQT